MSNWKFLSSEWRQIWKFLHYECQSKDYADTKCLCRHGSPWSLVSEWERQGCKVSKNVCHTAGEIYLFCNVADI